MTHLEQLHLSGCPISDDQLAYLSKLSLKRLNLVLTSITDEGLHHLRALPLVAIILCQTQITGSGLQYLDRKTLKYVSLSRCPNLTTDGLMHLQGLRLNHLSLMRTPITCLEFLKKTNVNTLNLYGCIQLQTAAFALEPPPQVKVLMARGLPQLGPEFEMLVAKWPTQLQRNFHL